MTTHRITPFLWFDHQAEEAAEFYTSIFPNSKIGEVTRYGRDMMREEGLVMTVDFTLDGQEYVGLNGGPQFTFTEAISFQIMCADQEEVDHYWTRLCDGGEEGPCGWLKDKFGVSWQINPTVLMNEMLRDPDSEKVQRVMAAVLSMGKLDIAELQRAAEAA